MKRAIIAVFGYAISALVASPVLGQQKPPERYTLDERGFDLVSSHQALGSPSSWTPVWASGTYHP